MTIISEEDEADVYTSQRSEPPETRIFETMGFYWKRIMKTLPTFTTQIVLIFCVLPISFSIAIFLATAILNFGVAFIAQTISTLLILLILIPTLAVCITSAIATAYILQLTQSIYLRLSQSPHSSPNTSYPRIHSPPPIYAPKFEVEEKLKTC
ncbi:uncharacterized protein CELE_Y76A2B.4 [Caenorhabditis elegans]|uniref:Uncharacterized protein n=1 Tax=Caenorhabditis elegans TaxID=6239 RepID=Q9XWD0_CAEEL|nr:Uncharacterized protein CELE_Y76A2B.4 [Caenorhabditis elegans]CAA21745.1 Uncharacterized protein CELE_Y76A2B.4 [Caenorhabditis elegans]|eukprot:NP_499800.1 Uncharacterized protein CELE_Y76A2B.4 [Caenorhabditis elegans]